MRLSIYWTHQRLCPEWTRRKGGLHETSFARSPRSSCPCPWPDAAAQAWPTKPLRAIVPVGAGSSTDIVHRIVLEQLSRTASGSRSSSRTAWARRDHRSAFVAKAEPDGHTLLANGSAHTIAPAAYKSLPYDRRRDFIRGRTGRHFTERAGGVAGARVGLGGGPRRCREARPGALNFPPSAVGPRRISAPSVRVERGESRRSTCLQGRRRGDARSHRRPRGISSSADRHSSCRYPGGQAAGARGQRIEPQLVLPDVPTLGEAGVARPNIPSGSPLRAGAHPRGGRGNRSIANPPMRCRRPGSRKLCLPRVDAVAMSPLELGAHVEKESPSTPARPAVRA
jgi:hypothetical protein